MKQGGRYQYGVTSLVRPSVLLPVTSSSSHTIEARELKFGLHNIHKNGSKVTNLIFDILLGS